MEPKPLHMKSEYLARIVEERIKFVIYEVQTPTITTRKLYNRSGYINKIVKRNIGKRFSGIREDGRFTLLRITVRRRDITIAGQLLNNLLNDIWSNNTLRKIIGR